MTRKQLSSPMALELIVFTVTESSFLLFGSGALFPCLSAFFDDLLFENHLVGR
jgi:hypothetical protein